MAPYMEESATSRVNGHDAKGSTLTFMNGHHSPTAPGVSTNGHLPENIHDLLCVGFGPASLAIAIALQEKFEGSNQARPVVSFLERQPHFAWHAGMLLPGSKMQISFIKDLATLRNPQSKFTFLNYLHQHGRLVQFANLGTFLPSRIEFEDYMRWCSDHFQDCVEYSQEVLEILPHKGTAQEKVDHFTVRSRNLKTSQVESRLTKNVVIAVGGKPRIPPQFPQQHPKVIHSSSYVKRVHEALPDREKPYRIAVMGNGQSAAEIFHDLHSRFPNSRTSMIIKDTALRPSDDSPFVNEVFNPERVDTFFAQPPDSRSQRIASDKSTNYGVVRLELLESIYADLYQQKILSPHEADWQHRILPSRMVSSVDCPSDDTATTNTNNNANSPLILHLQNTSTNTPAAALEVDAVFVGTGYTRSAHAQLLNPILDLLTPSDAPPDPSSPNQPSPKSKREFTVQRDYKIALSAAHVSHAAGIYLQGCNQDTHGLADTLLSILAVRGGEIVESIFGGGDGAGK